MAKVLVGLSGGVDSAVAAALLIEQGHDVAAGYIKNWINDEGIPGDCPWEQDIEDGRAIAKSLGIEFRVIDLIDSYRDRIVEYLIEGYRSGITPNPDVWCNREMKFGVFLDYALAQGFGHVATGHFASCVLRMIPVSRRPECDEIVTCTILSYLPKSSCAQAALRTYHRTTTLRMEVA